MEAEELADFLASASAKQLGRLQPDIVPKLNVVFGIVWSRMGDEKNLHGVYTQARALSALLTLQAKWRFPLEAAPLVAFLTQFLQAFVCENPLLWNEEYLRDCESILQTLLKYVQSVAPLPDATLHMLLAMLRDGAKFPKDVCTQLGLLYHSGLSGDFQSRLGAASELIGQGRLAYLRGIIFVSSAVETQTLLSALVQECRSPDVSLKHYAVNVSSTQTVEVVLTKLHKQKVPLTDTEKALVGDMLSQHFDYHDKSVSIRILHVLALLLQQYTEAEAHTLMQRIKLVKSSLRFRLLSEVLQVFGLGIILQYYPDIVLQCTEQSYHPSHSSPAMELLRRVLSLEYKQKALDQYFAVWESVLDLPRPAPLVLEEALRVCEGRCTEMILAHHPSLPTLITVLRVCRALKNFHPSSTGVRVFSCEVPMADLEAAITSVDLDLAADCLEVLTANPHSSAPLGDLETRLFLTYVRSAMKASDAHFRQRATAVCKKILLRARASLETQSDLWPAYRSFLTSAHNELMERVYPTSPIELLEPSMSLLDHLYYLFGSQPCTLGDRQLAPVAEQLLYSKQSRETIWMALDRPWDLIRRLGFRILTTFPLEGDIQDLQRELQPLANPRVHEAEAQAWKLLLYVRKTPQLFDTLLKELDGRAKNLEEIMSEHQDSLLPHGLMSCVRFALEQGEQFAPTPERMQQLASVLLTIANKTSVLLSKFAVEEGWDCRGHSMGASSEVATMGMWLACKENGLLLSQYAQWMLVSPSTLPTVRSLAAEFFQVLLTLKHRGSIVKTASGLADFYARLFHEELTANEPLLHLRKLLDLVKSAEDRALILRRSAGFPYALLTVLQSAPTTVFTATMTELLALCRPEEMPEVRIHALNILRYVLQDRVLKTKSEQFLAASLQAGVHALSSEDWSVRNSATLTFAAVLAKALGHEIRLTLSDLTARSSSLETDFEGLLTGTADPYPVLLLLQRLGADSVSRPALIHAAVRHLSSPNDMVRRVAAEATRTLASQVTLHSDKLSLDGVPLPLVLTDLNYTHGVLLVLVANAARLDMQAQLVQVFGLRWIRVPLIGETYLQLRIALKLYEDEAGVNDLCNRFLKTKSLRFEKDLSHSLTRMRLTEFLFESSASRPDQRVNIARAALTAPDGTLHLDDPEYTHFVLKHLRNTPGTEALCHEVLAVTNTSFASCWKVALQILVAANSLPRWAALNEIRQRLLSHSPLQSVLVKCLLKAAEDSDLPATAHLLLERCDPDEKDFVRTACAEALGEHAAQLRSSVELWRVAVKLLQDQVEAVRQTAAVAVSQILCPGSPRNASETLRLAFEYVRHTFEADVAYRFLVGELQAACRVRRFEFSAENKSRIFYKEPVNSFEEPLQVAVLALRELQPLVAQKPEDWAATAKQLVATGQADLPREEAFLMRAVTERLQALVPY